MILKKTNAKIVLTSTWRRFFKKELNKIVPQDDKSYQLQNMFYKYNIEIYDITSVNSSDINREKQINEWLSNRTDIDSFIIIDDELCMFNDLIDRVIKTKFMSNNEINEEPLGLCEEHIPQAIDMLNSKVKVLK